MAGCPCAMCDFPSYFSTGGNAMLQLLLLWDLTNPTPYAKSCHGEEYRVQGSRRRDRRRGVRLYSKPVST